MITAIYIIIGVGAGTLIGFLLGDRKASAAKAEVLARDKEIEMLRLRQEETARATVLQKEETERQISILKEESERRLIAQKNDFISQLQQQREESEKQLQQQREDADKQLQQQREDAEALHKRLNAEFEALSTRIFKTQTDEMKQVNAEHISNLLRPLGDNLKEFRERVDKVYGDEAKERFSLSERIKDLMELNRRMSEDANALTRALKGEAKVQGDWGEMILERLLETSGLIEGEHFVRQEFLRDEQGLKLTNDESGQKMQPDVIVRFPGEREMIIDSKVSLTAYTAYCQTEDTTEKDRQLKLHMASVKAHIDELSRKDYSRYDVKAPDFVVMFVPTEGAYLLAIQTDPNLWEYAYQRKVVLMSPTNLISALRLSLDLWKRENQAKSIQAIVDRGTALYEKLAGFTETFLNVGDRLKAAQTDYDKALKQFSTGAGNVIRQAEMLRGMGLTPKKRMSSRVVNEENEAVKMYPGIEFNE